MKKVLFFLINIFLGALSLFSEEKLNLELLEKYYTAENIPETEILDFYSKCKNIYTNNKSQENLIEYIKACTLLSTLYSSGEIPEWQSEIESVNQKKEILSQLIEKIKKFLIQFQEDKRLTLENIEWLREGMESDAINQKLELYSNNYLYLSSMSEFIQLNEDFEFKDNPSYYELFVEFIKRSLEMYQALTAADLLQYDYFESDNEADKIKMISHQRIHITKFYAQTILPFILDDIVKVINCYLEQSNE